MAERRMFAKKVIGSDTFMDMPMSTQILYIHLSMYADDDGFVGNPKMIQRMTRCDAEDFDGLIDGNYIIPFQSGVVAITHWKVNNQIKKDRYRETIYLKEKEMLCETETKTYELKKDGDDGTDWGTDRNSSGSKAEPQYSIVKDSTVKDSTVQFSLDEGCSDFSEEENGNEEEKRTTKTKKETKRMSLRSYP